jgi:ADP-ribosylglycohydrolase
MIGAIIGDVVGSVYEFRNIKTKAFPLFQRRMEFTDDSILTVATADWLLRGGNAGDFYRRYALRYPDPMGCYGSMFEQWVRSGGRQAYNSCGNGSAMRVGPVGWAFGSESEVLAAAKASAECTHNHPEGVKGAQAVALCVFLARQGATASVIRQRVESDFGYDLSPSVDDIRASYGWHGTCQGTVPQAIVCALEAVGFEDAVRNAVSIGGDSDTLACITGSIAETLFGVPAAIQSQGLAYLPAALRQVVEKFEHHFGNNIV